MSFVVSCTCGKQFRVADEQMGKKAKCKGCGQVLQLVPDAEQAPPPPPPPSPAPPADDDPFASVDWSAADSQPSSATQSSSGTRPPPIPPPVPAHASGAPRQKPCPACGSIISAFALRCEHCGANLTSGKPTAAGKPAHKLAYGTGGGSSSEDSDLTPGDWVLCIICSGIGCILGIYYLARGKPKGAKMIGISLVAGAIGSGIRALIEYSTAGAP
jgi:hypothetical protein